MSIFNEQLLEEWLSIRSADNIDMSEYARLFPLIDWSDELAVGYLLDIYKTYNKEEAKYLLRPATKDIIMKYVTDISALIEDLPIEMRVNDMSL